MLNNKRNREFKETTNTTLKRQKMFHDNLHKNRIEYINSCRAARRNTSNTKESKLYNLLTNLSDHTETNGHGHQSKIEVMYDRIYFTGPVTESSMGALNKTILEKNKEFEELQRKCNDVASLEPKPVYLWIQSYGGFVDPCLPVLDTIRNSKIPIYTVVNGYAASCGSLLSVVGQKRYMTKSSSILIHQLSGGIQGTMEEIKDGFENTEGTMEKLYKIYENHTKLDRTELEECMKHDIWWDVDKCISFGLIDGVYEGV